MGNRIIQGDCIEQMKLLEENSVDAIITDPPYGLGFMNKEWDSPAKHRELVEREMKRSAERKAEGKSPTDAPFSQSVQPGLAIKGAKENRWFQKWSEEWGKEAIRILKPGGHMLVCCATRMYHRMTCGIEDAGFEIRDAIMWIYGSGFPKSLNIGKQIDKLQGNEREVVGEKIRGDVQKAKEKGAGYLSDPANRNNEKQFGYGKETLTKGNSEWEGWGTALKPACEPIVVARKPLSEKNVALNVLKWGTGGINIDDCRIGTQDNLDGGAYSKGGYSTKDTVYKLGTKRLEGEYNQPQGRFPANIILECTCDKTEQGQETIKGGFGAMGIGMSDTGKGKTQKYDNTKSKSKENKFMIHTNPNCPCYMLDEQSGDTSQGHWSKTKTTGFGDFGGGSSEYFGVGIKDKTKHGASRFFYCAKASKSERNFGCEEMEQKDMRKEDGSARSMEIFSNQYTESSGNPTGRGITSKRANNHPTVKPIALMEYLVKLVSREGATILDPFLGSGTTLLACHKLNRNGIGIEKEEEYIKIAQARLNKLQEQTKLSA